MNKNHRHFRCCREMMDREFSNDRIPPPPLKAGV